MCKNFAFNVTPTEHNVTAGSVINSEPATIGDLSCSGNEIIKRKADGTGWVCSSAAANNGSVINSELAAIGDLSCSGNEIIKRKADGTGWVYVVLPPIMDQLLTANWLQ